MTAWAIGEVLTVSMLLIFDSSSASSRSPPSPVTRWSATTNPTRAPGTPVLANDPR